jgi:hypothetical protein
MIMATVFTTIIVVLNPINVAYLNHNADPSIEHKNGAAVFLPQLFFRRISITIGLEGQYDLVKTVSRTQLTFD